MGNKKKWNDNAPDNLTSYLNQVKEIITPILMSDGIVDSDFSEEILDLEYLMALILNCKFLMSENKEDSNFGADDVIAIKLEVIDNKHLKYWGKINWLSLPNNHECFKSFQDPFYALLKMDDNKLEIIDAKFGDYDKNDLDDISWIENGVHWMYDL